jgi:small multidrug resistance pump
MSAYWLLTVAIACEVVATISLKSTEGFSRLLPTVAVVVGYLISFGALGMALQQGLNLNVGYAIWSGVGTSVIAVAGVVIYHEHLSLPAILGLVLIVAGVLLLHVDHDGTTPRADANSAAAHPLRRQIS